MAQGQRPTGGATHATTHGATNTYRSWAFDIQKGASWHIKQRPSDERRSTRCQVNGRLHLAMACIIGTCFSSIAHEASISRSLVQTAWVVPALHQCILYPNVLHSVSRSLSA